VKTASKNSRMKWIEGPFVVPSVNQPYRELQTNATAQ